MNRRIRYGLGVACLSLLALGAAPSAQAAVPSVATGPPTHVAATHAQLHGTVDPEGETSVYWFQYGPADCELNPCTAVPADEEGAVLGEGPGPIAISQAAAGLAPETTYHFRILAKNASGTTPGSDEAFTTPPAPGPGESCPNQALREEQHATFLPECRAYEMVSPPEKNGGNINGDSGRTRAAADGDALGFDSLLPFADPLGAAVATDYVATRSSEGPGPLGTGWLTHAVTPLNEAGNFLTLASGYETRYVGEFTPNLNAGVIFTETPQTDEPYVSQTHNLYLRNDLLSPGAGSYQLVTLCPLCVEKEAALPAPTQANDLITRSPMLAGISPDGGHVVFESTQRLTADSPASQVARLFEWDHGALRLAGRIPVGSGETECDDLSGPACQAAKSSLAGQALGAFSVVRHVLSDGSDGHTSVFFTYPTKEDGTSFEAASKAGRLYVRVDGHRTIQLNASERASADAASRATFWDATASGDRAFFSASQALTDDAPLGGAEKLYMWSAAADGSGHHLTLLSPKVNVVVGAGGGGSYVYFTAEGQLVPGAPDPGGSEIYLWHEGALSYVGPSAQDESEMAIAFAADNGSQQPQARVTPDGTHLLFRTSRGRQLGYDANGAQELYLYDAGASTPTEADVACVSCPTNGEPAAGAATAFVQVVKGNSASSWHENEALSDDGSRAFFSTEQSLVPGDTNSVSDAYEYDAAAGEARLLSSGTNHDPSWFLEASPDGSNAFVLTTQRLVGWDHDGADDVYDARVGGGFAEPAPQAEPCGSAATCKESLAPPPQPPSSGSTIEGAGNPKPRRRSCPKGRRLRRSHGKTRCVKPRHKHRRKRHHRARAHSGKGGSR
jgi:hypothetical protein